VLAYLLSQDTDVYPIVGSKQISHFRQNMVALNTRLSPGEIGWLERGGKRPV
jgi:aryl-alcohol dehydrogenase-like predicted oxidoreductase